MFLAFFFEKRIAKQKNPHPRKLTWIPKIMGPWKSWLSLNLAIFGIYSLSLDSKCLQPTKLSIWILSPQNQGWKKSKPSFKSECVFGFSLQKKNYIIQPLGAKIGLPNWRLRNGSLFPPRCWNRPSKRHQWWWEGCPSMSNIPTCEKCWANLVEPSTISNWKAIFCCGSIYT